MKEPSEEMSEFSGLLSSQYNNVIDILDNENYDTAALEQGYFNNMLTSLGNTMREICNKDDISDISFEEKETFIRELESLASSVEEQFPDSEAIGLLRGMKEAVTQHGQSYLFK